MLKLVSYRPFKPRFKTLREIGTDLVHAQKKANKDIEAYQLRKMIEEKYSLQGSD